MPPPRTNSPSVGLADRALRVSESRYRRLFETARDGILLLNAETAQIDDVNPYLIEVLGYTHADFVGKKLWDLGLFADIALSKNMFAKVRSTGYVRYDYLPLKTKTGVEIAFEFISNSYDYEGIKVIQCNIRNITDRVAADAQAERRIRLYAALSQCNHTIVHCKTEEELLPEICRIAVELGGVKMAWVGMVDSETSSVRPAASWGDTTDYLNGIEISIHDDTPLGRGPIGRVIRENRPVWLQDFMHDPGMAPWQERMARSGFATSAAIPLGSGDNVIGVFIVYSGDSAFFDEPARDLLTQLAMDISFALDGFARDLRRKQAEDALQKSEHEFHTLAEAVPQIVWITSADGSNIYFNRRWVEYTGLSIEDSRGDGWVKQIHPDERDPVRNAWRQANGAIDSYSVENRLRAADGGYRWFLVRAAPLRDEAGIVIKWFGTCTDVHDLKTAEIKIRRLNRVYAVLSSISDLIVHVRDRNELFNETCRIAVEVGGFHLSVLCLADQSAIKFRLVAFAGSDKGLLSLMTNTFSSAGEAPRTLSAEALRDKKVVVANDYERDPRALYGGECAAFGVRSVAALPLIVLGEAVGVLTLCAEQIDFFDAEELLLLTERIENIGFAINSIAKQERLNYLAYYDELTGLANRSLFLERVGQYLRGETDGRHKIAVLLVDLDRFKNINDSLGRQVGDELLKQVAEWLAVNTGDANLVARLGPDHFGVVLPDVTERRNLERVPGEMVRAFLAHPFRLKAVELRLSFTAGVAFFPNDGGDAETLVMNAEAALKCSRIRGSRYLFYTATMNNEVEIKLSLETQLREALEKNQFLLFYQPKISLLDGKLIGAEALIRWNDPRTGLVEPNCFIPSLEETGLVYDVGNWALERAMRDYLRWRAAGLMIGRIAVNVSPIQLRDSAFIAELQRVVELDVHGAPGLELEITEGVIMDDIERSIAILREMQAMGLTIAIDDFGTGCSSLSYLARLPVDTLKIDRSFITEMTTGPEGLALVSSIINLGHGLKLKLVAEGVETEEQVRLLRLLGCDEMQGYYASRPLSAEAFEAQYLHRA